MNVWNDLIKLFFQMDIKNSMLEQALQKISDYLKKPSENMRMQAEVTCMNVISELMNLTGIKVSLKEEDLLYFHAKKIDAADYYAPFDTFRPNLRRNVESLFNMRTYLLQQPQTKEELWAMCQTNVQCHLLSKQLDYLGLNHFVVESKMIEEEKVIFKDMLKTLPTYSQIAVWEEDISILNAKIEKIFQDYESMVSWYARTVGENFSNLLKEKENAEKKLNSVGCDHKTFENIVNKIERDIQISAKMTRLERAALWDKMNLLHD